ncbi:sugar dehydrogenase complex small subunit [Paraburkholderia bannensis]|uniref:sugar dehydrogenase complex small subunit n=1 Tax=Paraburkholderia bannensis TaxID=765414 RepID=UPI002AC33BD3|nr:sugar dehydrogenase complex small subunit [Paraburkholderia bannensis]
MQKTHPQHAGDATRDAHEAVPSAGRRTLLKTLVAALTHAGFLAVAPRAFAGTPFGAQDFLAVSQALTGHRNLDAGIGARLFAALGNADRGFAARAAALAQRMQPGQTPQQLLAAADQANLRDTALAIVTAWYTGTVGHGTKAAMVTYANALMYGTVGDGMSPPTYCANGPLWWTAEPPPADVAPPAVAAAARRAQALAQASAQAKAQGSAQASAPAHRSA